MAEYRKDPKGRVLRKGESLRKDGRYEYKYTDPLGKRRCVYANDLAKLREKEDEVIRDQLDGLRTYVDGMATLNQAFDRHINLKKNIRNTTRANYIYMYDRYVRDTFGKKKLNDIVSSDVKLFYNILIEEYELEVSTVDSIHTIIHPVFDMAVNDDVIRKNPSDGAMKDIKKSKGKKKRFALTRPQQKAFLKFVEESEVYCKWKPVFVFMLGTGVRAGELTGLKWVDLDFEKRLIYIRQIVVYDYIRSTEGDGNSYSVSDPKTNAGKRTIPMLDEVYEALQQINEDQKKTGRNKAVIDGHKGFVFKNRDGNCLIGHNINKVISRIVNDYNNKEEIEAAKQKREPLLLPDFSCHILRHTFATRLCEAESNLKVIQSIMGHENIETTLDIYAEATEEKKRETFEELTGKMNLF